MAVIQGYPPNINEISSFLSTDDQTVFSYYPDIYNPSGKELEADLLLHENIHLQQQKQLGTEIWWKKYLSDTEFRLKQELLAFAAQLHYGKNVYPTKTSDQMKHDFAFLISGPKYQTGLSYQEAEQLLIRKTKEINNTNI